MQARAELTAAPALVVGGECRLIRLRDAAPVAWRPTPDAVYLVGTAASPVGRDQVEIDVQVEPGATLRLRSAAATVAWRAGAPEGPAGETWPAGGTSQRVSASVGDGARLDWHLEPFIATAGCHHRQTVRVELTGSGRVHWVEELVLGRYGEAPGRLDLRLDVDVNRAPLLRHQLALGPGIAGWDGPASMGSYRCLGLVLDAGGHTPPRAPHPSAGATDKGTWGAFDLEGPGTLSVAVAEDLPALRVALAAAAVARHTSDYDSEREH